jgi:hypothetical protein
MKSLTTKSDSSQPAAETTMYLFNDWLDQAGGCAMIGCANLGVTGHRHGHGSRSLMETFGQTEIEGSAGRLDGSDGKTTEWKSRTLRAYLHRTLATDALIARTYSAEGACELPGRVETCCLHTCREVGDDGD